MIGEKLGKYKVVGALGTGSMGTVYRAEDPDAGIPVAIKVVPAHVLYDIEKRERFLRCALTASGLAHPAICPILEIGDDDDDFFIVMPLLEGIRLDVRLKQGPIEWRRATALALAVCEALDVGHAAGAPHRGLRPSNIWLKANDAVVVTDFGLARFTEFERAPRPRPRAEFADAILPAGALAYMAPEQIRGEAVDFRTDIFSLGVVLYQMLTGVHPFESRNSISRMSAILEAEPRRVTSFAAALPGELDSILDRALAKDPASRYPDARSVAADLARLRDRADTLPIEAPATRPTLSRNARRALVLSLLALAGALAYAGFSLW